MKKMKLLVFIALLMAIVNGLIGVEPVQARNPCPKEAASATTPRRSDTRPLAELSPAAADYLAGRNGSLGVAVYVPSQSSYYSYNGDESMPLASVEKLITMLAVMDRAVQQNRALTRSESQLLEWMIEVSDNDSAQALWYDLGAAPGMSAYFQALGLDATIPDPDDEWGASRSTPRDLTVLLSKLVMGKILTDSMRRQALAWMSEVSPEQRWGVSAGLEPKESVALKNGWYPAEDGWWVGSVGVVSRDGQPSYIVAFLTSQQESFEYGVGTIEETASFIHQSVCELDGC